MLSIVLASASLLRPLPLLSQAPLALIHRPLAVTPRLRPLPHISCTAAAAADAQDEPEPEEGQASFVTTVFNTCKAALGAGVLALPCGVAKIGDVPAAQLAEANVEHSGGGAHQSTISSTDLSKPTSLK